MRRSPRSSTFERSGNGPGHGPLPPRSLALERLLEQGPRGQTGEVTLVISMGKGGTGKTTVAATLAARLARDGFQVLVASIDPAHNLADVLEQPLGPDPAQVDGVPGLWALEVDTDRALERYLEETRREVEGAYRYLETLNLTRYLEGLRYTPGVEEQATLEAVVELVRQADSGPFDALVLDTPPTGQTLRVLALPGVSLRWAEELSHIREAILEKRRTVSRIFGAETGTAGQGPATLPSSADNDAISRILAEYVKKNDAIRRRFQEAERTGVVLVRNPDRLSGLESRRALDALGRFGIPVARVVINRAVSEQGGEDGDAFPLPDLYPQSRLPLLQPEPSGVEALYALSQSLLPPGDTPNRGGVSR